MSKPNTTPTKFVFLLIYFSLIDSLTPFPYSTFNGFQDVDLYLIQQPMFAKEAQNWEISGLVGTNLFNQGMETVLGGPGVLGPNGYFKKTYYNLPPHDMVTFSMRFFIFDQWQPNDNIIIDIDGRRWSTGDFTAESWKSTDAGDPNYPDFGQTTVMGKLFHTANTAVLKIISNISNPSLASFGFNLVSLMFVNKVDPNEQEFGCALGDKNPDKKCPCEMGFYLDKASSTCKRCHESCGACYGPLPTQCFTCFPQSYSLLNNECTKCFDGCGHCKDTTDHNCLRCLPNYWNLWDNSCSNQCNSPPSRQEDARIIKLCKTPCEPEEYYLSNNSCSKTCPTLLNKHTNYFGNLCDLPCPSGQYYYHNNKTCLPTCESPYFASYLEDVILKCEILCTDGEYLYPNDTCSNSCNKPLVKKLEAGVMKCMSPCNNTSDYFYESEGACNKACDPPNSIKQEDMVKICITALNNNPGELSYNLTLEEVRQVRAMSTVLETAGDIVGATTALAMIFGSSNPAVSTLAGFVKMLPYLRSIDINYPPKLKLMLDNLNSSLISFSFGVPMPEELQDQFTKRPLPSTSKFEKYEFHSSFFVNYWPTMTSLVILMVTAPTLTIFSLLFKRYKRISGFFEGLKPIIQWNFILMIFCGNFDSIAIPTSLELRTVDFDSAVSVISFIFCLALNGAAIFCFYLAFHVIKSIRKSKNKSLSDNTSTQQIPSSELRWKGYQIFFKGSKDDSVFKHMYIIPYLARIYLFNLIIANLYEHPLPESIVIVIISILILASMLWLRPFISKLVFCQHVTDEIIMLTVNISMMILAIFDHQQVQISTARVTLGDIIIYSNLVFNITTNIYLIAYLAVGFKGAYDNMKSSKKRGILSFFIALLAPYEAGGMDLEAISAKEEHVSPTSLTKANDVTTPPGYGSNTHQQRKYEIMSPNEETYERLLKVARSSSRLLSPVNPSLVDRPETDRLLLESKRLMSSRPISPDSSFRCRYNESESCPLKVKSINMQGNKFAGLNEIPSSRGSRFIDGKAGLNQSLIFKRQQYSRRKSVNVARPQDVVPKIHKRNSSI